MKQITRNINGNTLGATYMTVISLTIAAAFVLTGCTATQVTAVKKQAIADLMGISEAADCPTSCDLLKEYIKKQLAGL